MIPARLPPMRPRRTPSAHTPTFTPMSTYVTYGVAPSRSFRPGMTRERALRPLDWATLRDAPGAASLSGRAEDVVASGDGSTLASLTGGTSTTAVTILDAASGKVRSRYQVRSSRGAAALSFDGSRLALEED